jgi:Dolichyl-phosphate-mannose-protein mannosyltransferase
VSIQNRGALWATKIQNTVCLAAIAVGWVAVLLIIPPQHEYPIIDDWIYARSVQHQVATGAFEMPAQSQASLVGLTLWGTAWVRLFGFSFTVLTYSTLVLALGALYAFYGIAREVGVPPLGALLGTGLLALNPIFFHLSYSFMTDVPFMCMLLLGSYCYIRGLKTGPKSENGRLWTRTPEFWTLLGGVFAGCSFLVRQFGLLLPVGFVLYLVLDGIVSQRWRWRQMIAVAVLPALVITGWYIWSHDMPPSAAATYAREKSRAFLWSETWLRLFTQRAATVIPLTALFAWTAVKVPRRPAQAYLPFLFLWGAIMALAVFTISLPRDTYSFVGIGNIVRTGGIDFFEYNQEPIWTPEVWKGLTLLGAALSVPVLAQMSHGLVEWVVRGRQLRAESMGASEGRRGTAQQSAISPAAAHRLVLSTLPFRRVPKESGSVGPTPISAPWTPRGLSPITGFYLVGGGIFVVSLGLLADLYDRYTLGFLPFVFLFLVRASPKWGRLGWGYAIVALLVLSSFTLAAKADFIDHNNARWQAGRWLQARVPVPVQVGFDWNNWYGFSNLVYQVSDIHIEGYRTDHRFPYFSRLAGFTTRYVLAESRLDAQPP